MAADELVPELHDIGKLLDNDALAGAIPGWPVEGAGHSFTARGGEPIDLTALGLPAPDNPTWYGVVHHHGIARGAQLTNPQERAWRDKPRVRDSANELILLMAADHLAASTSRAVGQEEGRSGDRWPSLKSPVRLRLWGPPQVVKTPPLVATREEVAALLGMLCADPPDLTAFRSRYHNRLEIVPEEKGFPRAVTTLRTHLELVGRYYRVCRRYSSFRRQQGRTALWYGNEWALSCAEVETKWRFRLARCRVRIATTPARLRDLGVFQRLEAAIDTLLADVDRSDHVLFATLRDLLLFLPSEEMRPLADVVAPLLEAGFHVEADVREGPLTSLTDWLSGEGGVSLSYRYVQPALAPEVTPPLCEVCQLAAGAVRWHRRPDDGAEQLCTTCAETRDRFSQRFVRLEDWETGYAAWLRVSLDPGALEGHLRDLFQQYVSMAGADVIDAEGVHDLAAELRTIALTVDYVDDFRAMLDDLAVRLHAWFPASDVETLTAQRKELTVVRIEHPGEILRILEACHRAAHARFPRSLAVPPFRIAASVGPVRFPFAEHWRLLQQVRGEVTVSLVGRGGLAARLEALPELLALARGGGEPRRALHRLAALASESPALARVAMADREERELAGVAPHLRRLGLDFESMATFARLAGD